MSAEMRFASPIRSSRPIAGFLILQLLFLGTFRCRFARPSAAHPDCGSGGLPRRMVAVRWWEREVAGFNLEEKPATQLRVLSCPLKFQWRFFVKKKEHARDNYA
ncbi:hypothetical protein MUK42_08819 [Musa troglodytarum]|uniref:Uncharacterized protein n=1 Tax=Musa troglodytarum TaxID=320322 RepID=A0A9E7FP48_9LILI|nr:hypothetical protein MUK42_08819 [Musa troglodytarum]